MPDVGLSVFMTWQAVVFALTTYVVTYVIRTTIQVSWKDWRKSKLYTDLFLHIAPIGNGLTIALVAKNFPWPDEIANSRDARIMFALVLSFFCGLFYGRVRAFLTGRKMDAQGNTLRPPAGKPSDEMEPEPEHVMEVTPSMIPPGESNSMFPPEGVGRMFPPPESVTVLEPSTEPEEQTVVKNFPLPGKKKP